MLTVLHLVSCGTNSTDTNASKADSGVLLETDKAFSKMSAEKGIKESFLFYAADDVIKMRNKNFAIMGKDEMKKMYEEDEIEGGEPSMTWEPLKADIAASGDLGYTFGNWKMRIADTTASGGNTYYGNYVSIWKKMADGQWKFVLDGSTSTPAPESK